MKSKQYQRVRYSRNQEKLIFGSVSMKYLPLYREPIDSKLEKFLIMVPSHQTSQEVKTYEWRIKTEFPIVKITQFTTRQSNTQNSLFQVELQHYPAKLIDLKEIPLFKILYLLKESIIGLERLFHLYGSFLVTHQMIALNMADKCKVWFNQNFASNQIKSSKLDEKSFLLSVYKLFETQANGMKNTKLFFQELNQHKTFFSALGFIEDYAKMNRIAIPKSYQSNDNSIFKGASRKCFGATLTMNQAPKKLISKKRLRTSLEHNSKSPLLSVLPQYSIEQNQEQKQGEKSLNLKESEDTAAQVYEKKSSGLELQDQFFIQNALFRDQTTPQDLAKSQFQPKLKSNFAFIRKFSDQYPQIKCCLSHSPKRANIISTKNSKPRLPNSRWNENSFINCQIEQGMNVNSLFNQNKWEKTLNGLFDSSQTLKKSVHNGKQQRLGSKFDLLDNFGKAIKQSFIHEQLESSIQY